MVFASSYPFFGVLWSMLVFFLWVSWFVLLFHVVADVFRRRDAGGWKKTAWLIFVVLVPFIGVFAYLIANNEEMAMRSDQRREAADGAMDSYVRSVAVNGGPAGEIERAKTLLDTGAITQPEFETIKSRALA